ncbi:unnamed protein product [Prorocentrum cordatum]|uniref:Phosphoglycerate mutase (2,3-diphosphoglycerate-dependent) n=1 Tax=Prorocentrum cordatum TaxID=2364126 RepID=A0ABN9T5U0_9DINO|nr:unnamed protein product [Polarella glacialis]
MGITLPSSRSPAFANCLPMQGAPADLIRHGESTANARSKQYREQGDVSGRAYHEAAFFDAPLTEDGRDGATKEVQVHLQGSARENDGSPVRRLVVTSTLHRALETATLGVLPLFPPDQQTEWIALESVREAVTCEIHDIHGVDIPIEVSCEGKPCNMRKPLAHARKAFPHVNFAHCADADPFPRVETAEMLDQRVAEFVVWLGRWVDQQQRDHRAPRVDVILVSHYVFLRRLMFKIGSDTKVSTGPRGLKNCEVRVLPLSCILQLAGARHH